MVQTASAELEEVSEPKDESGAVNREHTLIYGTQQQEGAIALELTPHS